MREIENLNTVMFTEYVAVNKDMNPVFLNGFDYSNEELIFLFSQYSWFSKKITSFFLEAINVLQYHGWNGVSEELIHNVLEELGEDGSLDEEYHKVTHYVLLRKGFVKSLGKDIHRIPQSQYTEHFIKDIFDLMNSWSPAIVAGASYALESSALKELESVYELLKNWFKSMDKEVPKELRYYFESHIGEIEIGHELRLRERCQAHLDSDSSMKDFETGFRGILQIMSTWWIGLDLEIQNRRLLV